MDLTFPNSVTVRCLKTKISEPLCGQIFNLLTVHLKQLVYFGMKHKKTNLFGLDLDTEQIIIQRGYQYNKPKMAKRANPFVDDFVQQSKVHVGLKQFNNNKDRLQKVYEKTLELLFKGAKKTTVHEMQSEPSDPNLARKDKMKQLVLGKNCKLEHSGSEVPNKIISAHCNCGATIVESQCAYCETALCSACQHYCSRCQLQFCSRCSLAGSEGVEICVSCYG